jgi:hypothetical protein
MKETPMADGPIAPLESEAAPLSGNCFAFLPAMLPPCSKLTYALYVTHTLLSREQS